MEKVGTPGWFLQLKRMNTPTIYNGWEQLTKRDTSRECFNIEEVKDFMPEMGVMVGRAVTVKIQPSNKMHKEKNIFSIPKWDSDTFIANTMLKPNQRTTYKYPSTGDELKYTTTPLACFLTKFSFKGIHTQV